ncbi:hypothetical protein [Pseudoalteromonas sp. Of7M-16]|uniref:defense against restriction DarA-related protein n=1 Tax=Pseudoalteromonas sp. Of7M-16 TaxID=2917756 RepID=UPI001EF6CC47|nr:hypothetical protein [Pseudoalteromonas sp. Of7M-16]MCG7550931.1 hypothetical protein [Pseudoalteromonas sp. Of7M-16]
MSEHFSSLNSIKIIDVLYRKPNILSDEALAQEQQCGLMFESIELQDIYDDLLSDGDTPDEMMLEAITAVKSRLEHKMKAFNRKFISALNGTNIAALEPEIGKTRKVSGLAILAVKIPTSDGQSISIIFHSPDNKPEQITERDTLVAFRFLLNSRDVTHVVAPAGGREVSLAQVTMALSNLLERNSAKFVARQAESQQNKEELQALQDSTSQIETKKTEIAQQVEEALSNIEDKKSLAAKLKAQRVKLEDGNKQLKTQIANKAKAKEKRQKLDSAIAQFTLPAYDKGNIKFAILELANQVDNAEIEALQKASSNILDKVDNQKYTLLHELLSDAVTMTDKQAFKAQLVKCLESLSDIDSVKPPVMLNEGDSINVNGEVGLVVDELKQDGATVTINDKQKQLSNDQLKRAGYINPIAPKPAVENYISDSILELVRNNSLADFQIHAKQHLAMNGQEAEDTYFAARKELEKRHQEEVDAQPTSKLMQITLDKVKAAGIDAELHKTMSHASINIQTVYGKISIYQFEQKDGYDLEARDEATATAMNDYFAVQFVKAEGDSFDDVAITEFVQDVANRINNLKPSLVKLENAPAYGSKSDAKESRGDLVKVMRKDIQDAKKRGDIPKKVNATLKKSNGVTISIGGTLRAIPDNMQLYSDSYLQAMMNDKQPELTGGRDKNYQGQYSPDATALLQYLDKLINAYHWDKSDSMSDYFHSAFYFYGFDVSSELAKERLDIELELYKEKQKADLTALSGALQGNVSNDDSEHDEIAELFGLDKTLIPELINIHHVKNGNINQFAKFDRLVETVNFEKAKAYLEKREGKELKTFTVNMLINKTLEDYIINYKPKADNADVNSSITGSKFDASASFGDVVKAIRAEITKDIKSANGPLAGARIGVNKTKSTHKDAVSIKVNQLSGENDFNTVKTELERIAQQYNKTDNANSVDDSASSVFLINVIDNTPAISKDFTDEELQTPSVYAQIMKSQELQEWYQDPLDSFFQRRIIAVRNELRARDWQGEQYKTLAKAGFTLDTKFKQVGAGANVVGIDYSIKDADNNTVNGSEISDDMSKTPIEIAAELDNFVKSSTVEDLHWYGLRARPLMIGAQPKKAASLVLDTAQAKAKFGDSNNVRHGAVAYDEPLSEQEISNFELVDLAKVNDKSISVEEVAEWIYEAQGEDTIRSWVMEQESQLKESFVRMTELKWHPAVQNRDNDKASYDAIQKYTVDKALQEEVIDELKVMLSENGQSTPKAADQDYQFSGAQKDAIGKLILIDTVISEIGKLNADGNNEELNDLLVTYQDNLSTNQAIKAKEDVDKLMAETGSKDLFELAQKALTEEEYLNRLERAKEVIGNATSEDKLAREFSNFVNDFLKIKRVPSGYLNKNQIRIAHAIENKDYFVMSEYVAARNRASVAYVAKKAGFDKVPTTNAGIDKMLREYTGISDSEIAEQRKKEADLFRAEQEAMTQKEKDEKIAELIDGVSESQAKFLLSLSPMKAGKAKNTLAKQYKYSKYGVKTRGEFIELRAAEKSEGWKVEHEQGFKKETWLANADGVFTVITKTEAEFFEFLSANEAAEGSNDNQGQLDFDNIQDNFNSGKSSTSKLDALKEALETESDTDKVMELLKEAKEEAEQNDTMAEHEAALDDALMQIFAKVEAL